MSYLDEVRIAETIESEECLSPNDKLIQDFIYSIDSKFEKMVQESSNDSLKYRVSQKETLSITFENFDDSTDYNFNIIIKKDKPQVEITGNWRNFQQEGNYSLSLTSKAFQKELDQLEFIHQDVNYRLMLFGLTSKEKFIKGKLKQWDRVEGKVIAKDDLGKIMKRKRKWEKKHLKDQHRTYALKECKKANCIFLKGGKCVFGLTPTNQKAQVKLTKAIGYCFEYQSEESQRLKKSLQEKHLLPLVLERFSFFTRINSLIKKLRKIEVIPFSHSVIRPFFSRKRLNILMELLHDNHEKQRKTFLQHVKHDKARVKEQFQETTFLLSDYIERKATNKAFKKARNDLDRFHGELTSTLDDLLSTAEQIIKMLNKQNGLISLLFEDEEREMVSTFGSFKPDSLVYFPYSRINDVKNFLGNKTKKHFNTGREKIGDDWHDIALSPMGIHHYNSSPRIPIFKVLSIKKGEVMLKQLNSSKEVRLIKTREYLAHNLYAQTITPRSTLNRMTLLLSLTAYMIILQVKPIITKQVSLTSFF